jgi:hypothetical protein
MATMCLAAFAAFLFVFVPAEALAQSSEKEFFQRFAARWTGGGTVIRDANRNAQRLDVSCSLGQSQRTNVIRVNGSCRAFIFTRPFNAGLTYDPTSGEYKGTYVDPTSGPAALSGRRSGSTLNLTMTWSKPVNGDRTAHLTIRNDGRNLAIQVRDRAGGGGPTLTTTDLRFARR